jgi:hypothetical protein
MSPLLRILTICGFLCLNLLGFSADAIAPTPDQTRLELIQQLERDGLLSPAQAQQARQKYLGPEAIKAAAAASAEPDLVERFVTLANIFKILGVVLLLVWAKGVLIGLAAGLWYLVAKVPKEVYQTVFLATSLSLTLVPEWIWPRQAFYLALFGAFANLMLVGWIIESHASFRERLERWVGTGFLATSLVSLFCLVYFSALALAYRSQVFGFFAAVSLSSMLSFGLSYSPRLLTLYFHERAMAAVVLGHLIVLATYCAARLLSRLPPEAALFEVGLQYYCTIAMGTGFLIAASPFSRKPEKLGYLVLFVAVLVVALAGYFLADLKVIGSIVSVFGVLLALEWLGHLSYRSGFLRGSFIMGVTLFAASLIAERFAGFLVLR